MPGETKNPEKLNPSVPSLSQFDLIGACCRPGCPLCRILSTSERKFVSVFLWGSVPVVPLRAPLRRQLGEKTRDVRILEMREAGFRGQLDILRGQVEELRGELSRIRRGSEPAEKKGPDPVLCSQERLKPKP